MRRMAVLLRVQEISKTFGIQTLFDGLSFSIDDGDRIGIIGPNGVGKSTLLKVMSGIETPDEGEVIARKGLRMAYVPQMARFPAGWTVLRVVMDAAEKAGLSVEERLGAASIVLGKVGFEDPEQDVAVLSGGWLKRLTLACGLVSEPDVVLFDEPTNHLDTEGVLWLEELLGSANFAWVLVTHDRFFLERSAQTVTELNPIFPEGKLAVKGNYTVFLRERQAFLENQQQYRESLLNKVRRETEWLRQGPKARTTKAKYRVDSAHSLIEELESLKQRMAGREAEIAFNASERQTRKLIETKGLTKQLGDRKIIEGLDLILSPGKRMGLLGTNGTGKTTILRMLLDELAADKGTVRHAPHLQAVYFDQNRAQLDPEMTLQEALSPTGSDTVVYQGRPLHLLSWAKRFKFGRDQLPSPVSTLSGGEQARLLIARLMLQPADVLLLDEPTNDLDIPTLELLEESLRQFTGALVLVTHDRYMLGRVCTHFVGLDGKGGWHNYGDYEQWERELRGVETARAKKASGGGRKVKETNAKKLSYNEQREWDGMEEAIMEAEASLEECQARAEDPAIASNGTALMEAHEALAAAEAEVSRLYERWSELSERVADD